MKQLQRMQADFGGRLNYLTDEMCQMNTRVGHIAYWQAHLDGLDPSPSPSPKAQLDDDVDDDKDDADSSSDDEITTSQ